MDEQGRPGSGGWALPDSAPPGRVATAPAPVAGAVPGRQGRDDLERLARGSSQNLAGSAVSAVLNVLLPVVIARGLDQDSAGTFFAATALFTILINVGTLGADTGLLRSLPRTRALGTQAELPVLLRVAFVPVAAFALVLSAVLVLLAPQVADLVAGKAPGEAQVFEDFLQVLALFLPVAVVYTTGLSASRGFGALKPLVLVEKLGRGIGQTALVWLALVVTPSLGVLALAWSLPYVAAALVLLAWLRRLYRRWTSPADADATPARPRAEVGREFWAFAAPRALSRIFSVALQRVDILVVGALLGPSEAAVYAVATRFLVLGLLFVQAIQQVMAPRISELLARSDTERANAMYRTTTTWLTIVSWPLYLLSAVFAPLLLGVFGDGYERGAPVVVILCLSMLVATSCGPVDTILLMGGRSSWSLVNTGLALTVNLVLDLLLVPALGITGAAVGWMVAILVNNLLPLAQVHRLLGMHPFSPGARSVALMAVGCFAALPLAVRLALGSTVPALLVAGVLGCAAYGLLLRWRSTELELDALTAVVRRKGGRRRAAPEAASGARRAYAPTRRRAARRTARSAPRGGSAAPPASGRASARCAARRRCRRGAAGRGRTAPRGRPRPAG